MGEGIGEVITFRTLNMPCRNWLNPKINLPVEVTGDPTYNTLMQFLDLPDSSKFEQIHGVRAEHRQQWFLGTSHRLLEKNWSSASQCSTLPHYKYILGTTSDGEQYHYEGFAVVEENTVENPLADGGASKQKFQGTAPANVRDKIHCANAAMDFTNMDSCRISAGVACVSSGLDNFWAETRSAENILVCGSHGEVGNDPAIEATTTNMFRFSETGGGPFHAGFGQQKRNVWSMIALTATDQLRQRVAFALSQILVVTPNQVSRIASNMHIHFLTEMHAPYNCLRIYFRLIIQN